LVPDTLEHEHSVEIFDNCRDLLYTDYRPVGDACQAFQPDALSLRHATKEEAGSTAGRTSGGVWRLVVKRTV
jgi:hypothetical protein